MLHATSKNRVNENLLDWEVITGHDWCFHHVREDFGTRREAHEVGKNLNVFSRLLGSNFSDPGASPCPCGELRPSWTVLGIPARAEVVLCSDSDRDGTLSRFASSTGVTWFIDERAIAERTEELGVGLPDRIGEDGGDAVK